MVEKIKVLLKVIKGFRKRFLFITLLIIITAMLESFSVGLITPALQMTVSEDVDQKNFFYKMSYLLLGKHMVPGILFLMMFCLLLVSSLLGYSRRAYQRYCEEHLKKKWRTQLYSSYMKFPYSFFVAKRQGEMIHNVINETDRGMVAINIILEFIAASILFLSFATVLFFTSFKISLAILLGCGLVYLLVKKFLFGYSAKVGRERIRIFQDLSSQVAETINGILQVKLLNLNDKRQEKFSQTNTFLAKMLTAYFSLRLLPQFGIKILVCLCAIVIIVLNNMFHFFDLKTALPLASTFFVVSLRLFEVVSNLITRQINIINYFPSVLLVETLLERQDLPLVDTSAGQRQAKADFTGRIELNDVHFSYGDKPVLRGLNFTVPAHSKVGIVGLSGSGKTTLVYLLLGVYMPSCGEILFDGLSSKQIDLVHLRQNIGVVTQDNFIFNGTIKENIAMGKEDVFEEEIIAAAKKANADEFIVGLKDGYDEVIGERGLNLSGGQRQRIAIARAIVRDPKIFIFDEATNSLDKESETLVIDAINKLSQEKSVITISHDFTTINNCDKIIFLKEGKVCEQGSHQELLDNKQEYWQLYGELAKRF